MRKPPRLSTIDEIKRDLKRINRKLIGYASRFPDEDCYATAYSVISDMTRHIAEFNEEVKPFIKEANKDRIANPNQYSNRARRWCVLNDSNRKQSTEVEETEGTDAEPG